MRRLEASGDPMEPITRATWQYVTTAHVAWEYDAHFADLPLFRYDTEVLEAVLRAPGPVIDLGCGTGRHVVALARQGFEVTGLDLSAFMLDVAREKLARESLPAKLVAGSMTDLDRFETGAFRYAICMFSTLGLIRGHIHRRAFLKAVRRILTDDGVLILHVHNRLAKLFEREGRIWLLKSYLMRAFSALDVGDMVGEYRGISDMYLHAFSLRELRRLLRESGFLVARMIPLNRARSGPLDGTWAKSLRANGFIAIART